MKSKSFHEPRTLTPASCPLSQPFSSHHAFRRGMASAYLPMYALRKGMASASLPTQALHQGRCRLLLTWAWDPPLADLEFGLASSNINLALTGLEPT
ncbi:hypothetical protein KEM48_012187 [Puccinia striiformis f. sp. tritici PST-130]|nr:hypothetical protein KEM48_012187 [Puccinia striiformis f. sp. tritici PST-130]